MENNFLFIKNAQDKFMQILIVILALTLVFFLLGGSFNILNPKYKEVLNDLSYPLFVSLQTFSLIFNYDRKEKVNDLSFKKLWLTVSIILSTVFIEIIWYYIFISQYTSNLSIWVMLFIIGIIGGIFFLCKYRLKNTSYKSSYKNIVSVSSIVLVFGLLFIVYLFAG